MRQAKVTFWALAWSSLAILGIGCLIFEFGDSRAQTFDVEHPLHSRQSAVEGGNVGLTVEVHKG